MKHLQEKELTLGSSTFKIRKFTPDVACYWATRLFGDLMAQANGFSLEKLPEIVKDFTRMERKDFAAFQRDCLSFVTVKFESGWHSLLNSDGHITKTDLKNPEIMALSIHSFMFSIADFFDPALLETMLGALPVSETEETTTGSSDSFTFPSVSNIGVRTISGTENTL